MYTFKKLNIVILMVFLINIHIRASNRDLFINNIEKAKIFVNNNQLITKLNNVNIDNEIKEISNITYKNGFEKPASLEFSCYNSISAKLNDANHPGIRFMAVVEFIEKNKMKDKIIELLPFIEFEIDPRFVLYFYVTSPEQDYISPEEIRQFKIINHPVANIILSFGNESVEPIIAYLNNSINLYLKDMSKISMRIIKIIAIMNEIRYNFQVNHSSEENLDHIINSYNGDDKTIEFIKFLWKNEIIFGNEGHLYSLFLLNPEKVKYNYENGIPINRRSIYK